MVRVWVKKRSFKRRFIIEKKQKIEDEISFDQGLKKTSNFFVDSLNKIVYTKVIISEELFRQIEKTFFAMDSK